MDECQELLKNFNYGCSYILMVLHYIGEIYAVYLILLGNESLCAITYVAMYDNPYNYTCF